MWLQVASAPLWPTATNHPVVTTASTIVAAPSAVPVQRGIHRGTGSPRRCQLVNEDDASDRQQQHERERSHRSSKVHVLSQRGTRIHALDQALAASGGEQRSDEGHAGEGEHGSAEPLARSRGECDRDRADAHEREEHDRDVHQEWMCRQAEQGGDLHVSLAPFVRQR